MEAHLTALPGELDFNYYVQAKDGKPYILKIANLNELRENLELQNAVIHHLTEKQFGLQVSTVVKSKDGDEILQLSDPDSNNRYVRLLTWVEGRVFATVNPHSPLLLERLGEMCGKLCHSLSDFDHVGSHRFMKWDPSQAEWIKPHLDRFSGERKDVVNYFYKLFSGVYPQLANLRKSVNYNDANDYNVLVSQDNDDPRVPGVIDFGDVVYTNTINELAIAIAYAIMGKPDPLEAAVHIVRGFNASFKIEERELSVLFPLLTTRILISVVCSELNRAEHPENKYLQISDKPAWDLLVKLQGISPKFAEASFRHACGLEPCDKHDQFISWVTKHHAELTSPVANHKNATWLDLSVGSLDVGNTSNLISADHLDRKISQFLSITGSTMAIGRYNEARSFYTTDAFTAEGNDSPIWRTVHIGLDFFSKPGTAVSAPLDGIVHSFNDNQGERNYGPTIILEHHVSDSLVFYTLYGHLSADSLISPVVGKSIKRGEVFARIGARSENGNWPPHLHFQIILDMLDKEGDFPGVACPHNRNVWLSLCPDPWYLLSGKSSDQPEEISKEEIVRYRKKHLGKNLSISFQDPIKVMRGNGVYLLDDTGRRYLDTVNNVAHVGHEHPRVVLAGQRQMAVLNTNTRYLHENIIRFTDALLATMPPKLDIAFFVNSGSEAIELSLRLAKNFTGQQDMIVSEVGYHGNTNACVEISSYKFDGAGGKGRAPHVHVVPIPDVYRGLYRSPDQDAGHKYANHIQQSVQDIQSLGRKPAALILESVISCGGQIELPANFLKESYQHVRNAGGVCIADEVQTGCGRVGDYFWGFEQHQVVPDIVAIGKPIGNGHPLGVVVTTQEIADAFKNGMEYFNTFGGNPVSCAIGLEVLKVIKDEGLQQNAKSVGAYLKAELLKFKDQFHCVGDVRGPGLFIGVEFVKNRETKEPATDQAAYFINRMRDRGVLMSLDGPDNNVLKIKPPIVFSKAHADFLLESIMKVLKEDKMVIG